MEINLLVWNLREFGCYGTPKQPQELDARQAVVRDLICMLVSVTKVDAIIIQEFKSMGFAFISVLAKAIGRDWEFDYIAAGIGSSPPDPPPRKPRAESPMPLDASRIDLSGVENSEGYAVLARRGMLAPFSPGVPASPLSFLGKTDSNKGLISLCTRGVKAQLISSLAGAATLPIQPAPVPTMGEALFPSTNAPDIEQRRRYDVLVYERVRRPCWIRIAPPGKKNPTNQDCAHIIVYHAPVNDPACRYATCACALIEQVQDEKNFPNVVVAGDFNLLDPNVIKEMTQEFKNKNMQIGTHGRGENTLQRSMVHFTQHLGRCQEFLPIDGHDRDVFYGSPRDFCLYRFQKGHNPAAEILDIFAELADSESDLFRSISGLPHFMKFIETQAENPNLFNDDLKKDPKKAHDAKQSLLNMSRGTPSLFAAALFYRKFISDHLPIKISFTI